MPAHPPQRCPPNLRQVTLVLDATTNNRTRIIPGFSIRRETLEHLGPMEKVWAKRLIAEGTWRLALEDEPLGGTST